MASFVQEARPETAVRVTVVLRSCLRSMINPNSWGGMIVPVPVLLVRRLILHKTSSLVFTESKDIHFLPLILGNLDCAGTIIHLTYIQNVLSI